MFYKLETLIYTIATLAGKEKFLKLSVFPKSLELCNAHLFSNLSVIISIGRINFPSRHQFLKPETTHKSCSFKMLEIKVK